MEDVFYYHILPFVSQDIFHKSNMSLLCKHKLLQKNQKLINRKHSNQLLYQRFLRNNKMKEAIHFFLDDYTRFLKYMIELLLQERDMDVISETYTYEKHKILVPKYVISNTIIEYDNQQKISSIDFTLRQEIIEDVQICSTYRLGIIKKQVLVDHMPYAKALIY